MVLVIHAAAVSMGFTIATVLADYMYAEMASFQLVIAHVMPSWI